MADIAMPYLTPSQIHSLADLVPARKPLRPQTSRALHPLLSTLHPKWLRDFLFTSTAIHLPHLLSPTLPTSALTCLMQTTSVDPQTAPPLAATTLGESHHFSGHVLFAPAFTADRTTLGVGVLDAETVIESHWLLNTASARKVRLNHRFVLDAKSRTLLVVYDIPRDDCALVFTSRLESSTRARNFVGAFRRSELHDAVLQSEGALREECLRPALMLFQEEVHRRPCAVCAAPPHFGCGCEFPLVRAAHLFDSDFFFRGMFHHVSTSEAVANKVLFDCGGQERHIVMGSRMSLQSIANQGILQRLRSWSVSEHFRNLKEDPLQSLLWMKQGGGLLTTAENIVVDGDNVDADDSINQQTELITDLTFRVPAVSFVPTRAHNEVEKTQLMLETTQGLEQDQVLGFGAVAGDVEDDNWWEERCQKNISRESLDTRIFEVISEAPREISFSGTRHLNVATAEKGFPSSYPAQEDSRLLDCTRSEELAKKFKIQERRERNRAAARRSNIKRKELREGLKRDVQMTRERLNSLRERELLLRKENLSLRKALDEEEREESLAGHAGRESRDGHRL